MKKILIRLPLLFFGFIFGLIITEGILRFFDSSNIISIDKKKSFAKDPFIYSSSLKYRVKPYLARECTAPGNPKAICHANRYGLRDHDYKTQKPENVFRIILLGDSLTYGPGVNSRETYPEILKTIVSTNKIADMKIEIINMGMIFYGPAQYYNLYQELAKKYNPDLIILSYHLLTDPYDAYEYEGNKRFYFLKALPDKLPYFISQPLKENSFIFRTMLSAYYSWANRQEMVTEEKIFKAKNRYQYETQINTGSIYMKKGWQLSEHYLNKLCKSAIKNGSKVIIVAFPPPAQILPDEWKVMLEKGYVADSRMYSDSGTRRKFSELCQRNKWLCLDLQDSLREAEDINKLFLKGDIHLTNEGNKITAKAIYDFLKLNKLMQ